MSVLVVGSVAYDGIETPMGKTDRIMGGSASYISITSSFFANPVRLVGTVGKDFDEKDLELFKFRNIDLEGFKIDQSGRTFFWKGRYHDDFNNRDTLDTQLNVFENFDPVIPDAYIGSRYVCLGNIDPKLQLKVLDQVSTPDLVICDTMNFWISGAKEDLLKTLKRVDVLIINDSEARELTNQVNLIRAAEDIRKMGPSILIIKKGEHGAQLFSDEGVFAAPAYPLSEIYDPTGAGDSFLGGFTGWLARTKDHSPENLRRAVIFGSVMASFCVEDFGPNNFKELSEYKIMDRYEEMLRMSHIPKVP